MNGKINGIAFFEEGPAAGRPLVFIHGFPFNHSMWDAQAALLSKEFRVITYDLRGHGQSDAGDGQYTVEMFVDDLILLMDHLKIAKAAVCGLSLGGYIALRAVERHPERFNALVLCDTKSEADGNEAKIKRAGAIYAVKKDGVPAFSDSFIKGVLTEDSLKNKPELATRVLAMIRGNSALGISGTLLAMAGRTDTTPALSKMGLPALILVGEQDKLTPPAVSESMQRALVRAQMHQIPAAAHLSNLENPDVFNEHLRVFLKTL